MEGCARAQAHPTEAGCVGRVASVPWRSAVVEKDLASAGKALDGERVLECTVTFRSSNVNIAGPLSVYPGMVKKTKSLSGGWSGWFLGEFGKDRRAPQGDCSVVGN